MDLEREGKINERLIKMCVQTLGESRQNNKNDITPIPFPLLYHLRCISYHPSLPNRASRALWLLLTGLATFVWFVQACRWQKCVWSHLAQEPEWSPR